MRNTIESLLAIAVALLVAAGVAWAGSQGGIAVGGIPLFALAGLVAFVIQWQECRVCARDTRRVDPSPPGLAQGDSLLCPGSPCGPSRTRLPVGPPGTTVPTNGSSRVAG